MSVNAIESADAQPVAQTQNSELIYRLEDRPPLPQTLFAACQHLLAMFVAVITPALLICQALGLPAQDTQHIISMSLFASRRSLYYSNQSVGAGRIGAVIHPGNQF
ncbi:uracil-xanthine permease [Salmonella enterica subsp. enterica serovar Enteritidis]|nr:uracil-xanthine permease [Salmonella enterica subsp. enterica serovar Enteritidis]